MANQKEVEKRLKSIEDILKKILEELGGIRANCAPTASRRRQ